MAASSSSIFRISFAVLVAAILLALSQSGGSVHALDTTNYVDTGICASLTPCYDTIQEGVDNVADGGTVNVFPGTYDEGVDLGGADGGLTLITVDPSGTPTPGTVTINAPDVGGSAGVAIYACDLPGAIIIDGFTVISGNEDEDAISTCGSGDITIKNVTAKTGGTGGNGHGTALTTDVGNIVIMDSTANGNADDGFELAASTGDITVSNSTANGNGDHGLFIQIANNVTISGLTTNGNSNMGVLVNPADGNMTVSGSTANDNGTWGFDLVVAGDLTFSNSTANGNGDDGLDTFTTGNVTISGFTANGNGDDGSNIDGGNVTISGSIANDNEDDGIEIDTLGNITVIDSTANNSIFDEGFDLESDGDIVICGVTAIGNAADGIDMEEESVEIANASVKNSVVEDNGDDGIDFDTSDLSSSGTFLANGNNISGQGLVTDEDYGLDLDGAVTVDATGNWWGDASGPEHPNNPGGTGDGVGDSNSTDPQSGNVDFDPFLTAPNADAGICEPPPEPTPTATAAAAPAPTATVAAAVQLPTTGGTPSDGGASALTWLAAIAGAIALIGSGSAWFAYQRRRVR